MEFLEREDDCEHLFFNLCVSSLGFGEHSACICNWSTSLQEGCSQTCLASITLDLELSLGIVVADDWWSGHQSLDFSKCFLLLLCPVEVGVLSHQSTYWLHVELCQVFDKSFNLYSLNVFRRWHLEDCFRFVRVNLQVFFAEDMALKWHFCIAQRQLVLVEHNSVCFASLK